MRSATQEHDGTPTVEQQPFFAIIELRKAARRFDTVHHHGERFIFAILALAQRCDRALVGRIDGKVVPEGVEGRVPYRGTLASNVEQLIGGLQAGMGYIGAHSLSELRRRAKFIRVSEAGQRESHVHDVFITKESPNYRG